MKKNRKEKLKQLRRSLEIWQSMHGEVHMLSPCDPKKIQYKQHAKSWKNILNSDPELFELLHDIYDFEQIFQD